MSGPGLGLKTKQTNARSPTGRSAQQPGFTPPAVPRSKDWRPLRITGASGLLPASHPPRLMAPKGPAPSAGLGANPRGYVTGRKCPSRHATEQRLCQQGTSPPLCPGGCQPRPRAGPTYQGSQGSLRTCGTRRGAWLGPCAHQGDVFSVKAQRSFPVYSLWGLIPEEARKSYLPPRPLSPWPAGAIFQGLSFFRFPR